MLYVECMANSIFSDSGLHDSQSRWITSRCNGTQWCGRVSEVREFPGVAAFATIFKNCPDRVFYGSELAFKSAARNSLRVRPIWKCDHTTNRFLFLPFFVRSYICLAIYQQQIELNCVEASISSQSSKYLLSCTASTKHFQCKGWSSAANFTV